MSKTKIDYSPDRHEPQLTDIAALKLTTMPGLIEAV
jgi:hypothetical protein